MAMQTNLQNVTKITTKVKHFPPTDERPEPFWTIEMTFHSTDNGTVIRTRSPTASPQGCPRCSLRHQSRKRSR